MINQHARQGDDGWRANSPVVDASPVSKKRVSLRPRSVLRPLQTEQFGIHFGGVSTAATRGFLTLPFYAVRVRSNGFKLGLKPCIHLLSKCRHDAPPKGCANSQVFGGVLQ